MSSCCAPEPCARPPHRPRLEAGVRSRRCASLLDAAIAERPREPKRPPGSTAGSHPTRRRAPRSGCVVDDGGTGGGAGGSAVLLASVGRPTIAAPLISSPHGSSLPSTISSSARKSALLPDRRASISPSRGRPGNRQPGEGDQAGARHLRSEQRQDRSHRHHPASRPIRSWREFARSVCLPRAYRAHRGRAASGGADQVLPRSALPAWPRRDPALGLRVTLITRSDIVAASARIAPYVVRTPLRRWSGCRRRRGRRLAEARSRPGRSPTRFAAP